MQAFINLGRFLHAVEFVSANYYTKPYSITLMFDRWFNQLAIIELENGKLFQLSGNYSKKFLILSVNNEPVDKNNIALIERFYSKSSTYVIDKEALLNKIMGLYREISNSQTPMDESLKTQALEDAREELRRLELEKENARGLYELIVALGKTSIDKVGIEKHFKSKIKNIVYRPNHELTHAVRVAYLITTVHTYRTELGIAFKTFTERHLEQLQLMMLFSVVGRRDETGFNDSYVNNEVYKSFRITSGREYLSYSKQYCKEIYPEGIDGMYKDAIVVELMGYHSLDEYMGFQFIPGLFIDYVREKENQKGNDISESDALTLIQHNKYSLEALFDFQSKITGDEKLKMMNDAHSLDLIRCYPLFPNEKDGPNCLSILTYYLTESKFLDFIDVPSPVLLTTFFTLMRRSFDLLEITGQKSTFGMLSKEEFNAQKAEILTQVQRISDRFKEPSQSLDLLYEAQSISRLDKSKIAYSNEEEYESFILNDYRRYLIIKCIAEKLEKGKRLLPDARMFQFYHTNPDNPELIDNHKNAVSLIHALPKIELFTGIIRDEFPVVNQVKYEREPNKVTLIFTNKEQANRFASLYNSTFRDKLISRPVGNGTYRILGDRKKYRQLVEDKLIQFSLVSIPKVVSGEANLVDVDGVINVLNLISHSRALVRLVSTSSLNNETFPDYDYIFRALEDPIHGRYAQPHMDVIKAPIDRTQYTSPINGVVYQRRIVDTPTLSFQEPITSPPKWADKIAKGWTIGAQRQQDKNTIYAPKFAHSLLPPHGKVIPFSGYTTKASNYFPIGILSDIDEVYLKDERYVWTKNMGTVNQIWIRDMSIFNKGIYTLLHAQLNENGVLKRNEAGSAQLDKSKIHHFIHAQSLLQYVQSQASKFKAKMDVRYYRPTKAMLDDCTALLKQEETAYLEQLAGDEVSVQNIQDTYKSCYARIEEEASRTGFKYSLTIRQLIEQQKRNSEAVEHNEILASNTKGAIRALYACTDELFARLNLVFHAIEIKNKYHYDVPLLVMSKDNSPKMYTETMIKEDLLNAYQHLRNRTFPYNTTLNKVYEADDKGRLLVKNDNYVVKLNEKGKEIKQVKNQQYQQRLLINLFQLGLPDLQDLRQFADKSIVNEGNIEPAVFLILDKLDLVGRYEREKEYIQKALETNKSEAIEALILREITLGHQTLVETLFTSKQYKPTLNFLEKAINLVNKNANPTVFNKLTQLKDALSYELELKKIEATCNLFEFNTDDLPKSLRIAKIKELDTIICQINRISKRIEIPVEITKKIKKIEERLLLNVLSVDENNLSLLCELRQAILSDSVFQERYILLLEANNFIDLSELLSASKEKIPSKGIEHTIIYKTIISGVRGCEEEEEPTKQFK